MRENDTLVTIRWSATPFRGDKFEEAWRPHAAAALDYGASWWAFLRSKDDPLEFTQIAVFASKDDWERYWFSEELAEARAEASGMYVVPLLPVWQRVVGTGAVAAHEVESR